jgi:hypothetical protein
MADGDAADGEDNVEQAAFLMQQPAASQPTPAPPQPAPRRSTASRTGNTRLASMPNMFGDLGLTSAVVGVRNANGISSKGGFDVPIGAGSKTAKIAENDNPIPVDRIFFNYNHFQNVFSVSEQPPFGPSVIRQEPIDRYTIGFEKTFNDGQNSIELRMPFNGTFDTNLQTVGVNGGNIGNLAVVLKSLLYLDDNLAVGAGMAIDTPTATDITSRLGTTNLRFENQAVHVLPYVGFIWNAGDPTWGWGDGLFVTGFAQIDVATNGNPVNFVDQNRGAVQPLGKLTEQNLGFLDLAVGYWLYRDPFAERLTGLAAVTEIHYTTTLQDADVLAGGNSVASIVIGSRQNRFDVVNGTIGVQALLFDASSLRVAGVFPIGDENHRLFDSEVQVQFNRRF